MIIKSFLQVAIVIPVLLAPSVLCAQYHTDEKRAEFYLAISQKYAPAAYEILSADEKKQFTVYANGAQTAKELMNNYGTAVHESCHSYNFYTGVKSGWGREGYFITTGIKIDASKGSFFPSFKLNDVVPADVQKKVFRYSTYVSGESNNHSSTEGVYGFLNEFSAYYHGTRADFEMLPYYETVCPYTDAKCWLDSYLGRLQSDLYAYYEFRLFIAWYLLYAEQHEQKTFHELINNQNLRVAYTLLDGLYKKLVDDYFTMRKKLVDKLILAGSTIELSNEFIYLVSKSGSSSSKSGTGLPDDDIAYLKSLYTEKETAMLERFRLKGVSLENYKEHLVRK